jgi:hypothetical protein
VVRDHEVIYLRLVGDDGTEIVPEVAADYPFDPPVTPLLGELAADVPGQDNEGYDGLCQGGIWKRPLRRDPPQETPHAFWATIKGRGVRPALTFPEWVNIPHAQEERAPSAYNAFAHFYITVPANESGKERFEQIARRLWQLLHTFRFMSERNTVTELRYADGVPPTDNELLDNALTGHVRYLLRSREGNVL